MSLEKLFSNHIIRKELDHLISRNNHVTSFSIPLSGNQSVI